MISIVYGVEEYRKLLEDSVKSSDVVLELGPHTGKSTLSYLDKAKLVVVVDKARQSLEAFKPILREHSNLVFVQEDVRGFEGIKAVLGHIKECDVLAVDLGGGRHADTVFKVWATWSGTFKPRDSIIRSRALGEFVRRARLDDECLRQEHPDSGWLSTWGRATPYKLKRQLEEFRHWIDIKEKLD